jgi:sulfoxide reductase heme-binding subunit YedZ
MAAALDPGSHLFWITSRAAGICAMLASSLALGVGLLQGGAVRIGRRGLELRVFHEALSLATLVAVAIHGVSLLGDSYLHPGIAAIVVPFTSAYRTIWTGIGIISAYGLAVLGLSYYARSRIGPARWRSIHRLTALFWVGGIVHSLGAGTDAGTWWFLALLVLSAGPAALLLGFRWLSRGRPVATNAVAESSFFESS